MKRQERYDLGPLADFMAEDILSTPPRHLVDEVTEDCGDPEALASAFDQSVHVELPSRGRMKILVVDDHVLIRQALRSVLKELRHDITVLEAADSGGAMEIIAAEQADLGLILLDLNLPDRDGFAVLSELQKCYPAISVVVLSTQQDRKTVAKALDLGARGFIPKSGQRDRMLGALRLVFAGGIYIPPEASEREEVPLPKPALPRLGAMGLTKRQLEVLALLNERDEAPLPKPALSRLGAETAHVTPTDLGLTGRQLDVLALLMQGKNNKSICRALNLTEPTVNNHVAAILKALKVTNRTEAVIAVRERGWALPRVEQS